MPDMSDWLLSGQERYLQGARFRWQTYQPPRPGWDHDHCEFCYAKFMDIDAPDVLREGYVSDKGYWVCSDCFPTFRDRFAWELAPSDETEE